MLLTFCQIEPPSKNEENAEALVLEKHASDTDKLPILDTIIAFSNVVNSKYKGLDLNDSIAKTVLYDHFKKQGCFTLDNLPDRSELTNEYEDKLVIDYTSIFKADLNNNQYTDAVIVYWLNPPYVSGHCWQPHKAIIMDTDSGYQITNEEFIPTNYTVARVSKENGHPTIFGYDYDCGNHRILQNLRIRLKFM